MAEEQTFETFVTKERARLKTARDQLLKQRADLQEQLDDVDAQMRAIDAYEAVRSGKPVPSTTGEPRKLGPRRTGIRQEILEAVQAAGQQGITPAELRAQRGIGDDDKSGAQSVSNALAALKKMEKIVQGEDSKYRTP